MRILIIEDDYRLNELLRRYLVDQGYAVDTCSDGEAGLDYASQTDYDAIILDIIQPAFDSFAVCRELRRQQIDAPVLLLTARASLDDRVNGLDSGADDYLTKPFALRELGARLRALTRRQISRSPELTVADLIITPATHEVRRGGRLVAMNRREYAILEYLARSADRIVTRSMIAEHVWNYEDQPLSNIVDVYISRIRRKVDDDCAVKLLETVRGVGYRLHAPDNNGG